jgi:predicted transcriptional regulator
MRMRANNNGPVYCLCCLPGDATFGQRLKARRLAKGITLRALCEQTGIVCTLLSKYERDVVEPKCRTVMKLIRVLGTELMAAGK